MVIAAAVLADVVFGVSRRVVQEADLVVGVHPLMAVVVASEDRFQQPHEEASGINSSAFLVRHAVVSK